MATDPDNTDYTPADLNLVASYPGHHQAHERGLVALSMGIPYWVLHSAGSYHLLVESEFAPEVHCEVAAYDAEIDESIHPAPAADPDQTSESTIALAYCYCISLAAAFLWQKANEPWSVETFGNDTLALFDLGEWWRPATALALHGDLAHLLGNMAFGTWFGVLAARALGPTTALLAILLGGIFGNTLSAAIYYPDHRIAIGASTAVFAALGVLVGNGLVTSLTNRNFTGLASRLAPLGGGLALLALTAAGAAPDPDTPGTTDILAHVCGFALGLPLGVGATTLARFGNRPLMISD